MFKRALALASLLLVAGCGGPEFAVSYRYVPPKDNSKCLARCEADYSSCRLSCQKKRQECLSKVRQEAVKVYSKELSAYNNALVAYQKSYSNYQKELLEWNNNYRHLYKDYLYFKKACKKTKDFYACQRRDELEEALQTLNEVKPTSPVRPKKPSLEGIVRELSASCPSDCGCKESYDACFTSCGGQIIPEKFCVRNCK
ncbi:hypothetical protein [Thermovibrio sp.]